MRHRKSIKILLLAVSCITLAFGLIIVYNSINDKIHILLKNNENNIRIYCDEENVYFQVDEQVFEFEDIKYSNVYDIFSNDMPYQNKPHFSLYTITKEKTYFVVKRTCPTNRIGQTADSWFFQYANDELKLIENLNAFEISKLFPEWIEYTETGEGMIKFFVPNLGKEILLRPTNEDFTKYNDNRLYFYGVTDFYVENDIIIMNSIIYNYGTPPGTLSGSIHLKYDITDEGLILVDLIGPN